MCVSQCDSLGYKSSTNSSSTPRKWVCQQKLNILFTTSSQQSFVMKVTNNCFLCIKQDVRYLSHPPGVVLCASGTQTLSIARFTVITALSSLLHHATPTSVVTPVDTSGWTSQEQRTMSYLDAQVRLPDPLRRVWEWESRSQTQPTSARYTRSDTRAGNGLGTRLGMRLRW